MPACRLYHFFDLLVDLDRQHIGRDGVRLEVGGLSFRLFEYLLGQGDRVVGFDELILSVWAPAVVGEETVTQRIKLLRQALGDDGRQPRYIRSVRGRGYQLCGIPECHDSESDNGPVLKPEAVRRPLLVSGLIVGLLAALAAIAWWTRSAQVKPAPGTIAASGAEASLQRATYYARIGQDANNERAIQLYQDALAADPALADAKLGLSRALSARMCLYNRGALSIERAESLAREVIAVDASSSRAHDALAYSYDCRGYVDAALGEYERAVALDPKARFDSRASAAYLYAVKGRLFDALKANIEVANRRAALHFYDIQLARNLELLGFVTVAEQAYERSFRLYPDSVYSNVTWPRSLYLQGRFAEAESAILEALQRPMHPDLYILRGELALLRGNRAEAHSAFSTARELRPNTSWPDTLQHLYADRPADTAWIDAQANTIRSATRAGEHAPDMYLELCLLMFGRGDPQSALDALDEAVSAGFTDRAYLQISPLFRGLTAEPRLMAIIDRIGQHVAKERARVLAADWLPSELAATIKASP